MDTVAPMTDTQPSVEALYRADAERLWRALFAFAGDAEIASDAVNEAYVQVIGRGDAVRDPAAWVWRTAFRIARGALQARRAGDRALAPVTDGAGELDRYADPDPSSGTPSSAGGAARCRDPLLLRRPPGPRHRRSPRNEQPCGSGQPQPGQGSSPSASG